ncbi:MAG: hypothetical protein GY810_32405 [Aureispira sp.]|nr:hypothetical protein [Aureispira sp.]
MSRNYTEQETEEIVAAYVSRPTMDMVTELSVKYRKTRKSIIAKLSKENVYIRKVYTSKSGDIPITKQEILTSIQNALGKRFNQLDKAPKATLLALEKSVIQLQNDFEVLLEEYNTQCDANRVKNAMLSGKVT